MDKYRAVDISLTSLLKAVVASTSIDRLVVIISAVRAVVGCLLLLFSNGGLTKNRPSVGR